MITNTVFVLLGSNIEKEKNIPAAVNLLREMSHVKAVSRVYETCPVGLEDQPLFFNAAVMVKTVLNAWDFRSLVLDEIEARLFRVRTADKNAPRTIDADLLLFNREVFDLDSEHHIPDPDLLRHLHTIVPTAELDPHYVHPETGETLGAIANRMKAEIEERDGDLLTIRPDIRLTV
jgi:2-amino-4-hydroxy-6-hydroxymethyldihydropteridine diphosphokinase